MVAIAQQQRWEVPGVRLKPVPVQQDNGCKRRVAPIEVVQPHAVQLDPAIFGQRDARRLQAGRSDGLPQGIEEQLLVRLAVRHPDSMVQFPTLVDVTNVLYKRRLPWMTGEYLWLARFDRCKTV